MRKDRIRRFYRTPIKSDFIAYTVDMAEMACNLVLWSVEFLSVAIRGEDCVKNIFLNIACVIYIFNMRSIAYGLTNVAQLL